MLNQRQEILIHLQTIGPITPLEALTNFGCFRLGARIWELRAEGHKIATDLILRGGKRFAQYSIIKES